MSLFGLLNRQPPKEVIKAACDFYGLSTKAVSSVQAEKLKALSNNIWLVNLDERTRAIVAYTPGDQAVAAPWYE
jgi:hypothetical protein